jgi:hypothetical protein
MHIHNKFPKFTCKECNKVSFSSKAKAKIAIRKLKIISTKSGYLHSYKCPHDDRFYHIGHSKSIERRKYK